MPNLTKRLYSVFTIIIVSLIIVGCRSNDVELIKKEHDSPDNESDNQTTTENPKSKENDNQTGDDSNIIYDEESPSNEDSELPKKTIPKGKIDNGINNEIDNKNTKEEQDLPSEESD